MKRKIVFLSSEEYSKDVLDNINECFDKGYEIEQILNAICGYYIILILKDNINCDNEGAIVETVDINGNSGTVIQHTEFSGISIVWSDGEYIYQMITQSTSLDELIHLCRSVQ